MLGFVVEFERLVESVNLLRARWGCFHMRTAATNIRLLYAGRDGKVLLEARPEALERLLPSCERQPFRSHLQQNLMRNVVESC